MTIEQLIECIRHARKLYDETNEYGKLNAASWLGERLIFNDAQVIAQLDGALRRIESLEAALDAVLRERETLDAAGEPDDVFWDEN
jgi:hypothetical protein